MERKMNRKLKDISQAYQNYLNNGGSGLNQWTAFRNGVSYADKNPIPVWHNMNDELPKENEFLLVECYSGRCDIVFPKTPEQFYYDMGRIIDKDSIKQWAYIKDLLPKGGRK